MEPNQTPRSPQQPKAPIATPITRATELPHGPEKLLTAPHQTSWGAALGIVIILILLVIGALYFWGAKLTRDDEMSTPPIQRLTPEADPSIRDTGFEPEIKVSP